MTSLDILRKLYRGSFRDNYYKIKETMRDDGKIDLPSDWDFCKLTYAHRRFVKIVQEEYRRFAGLDDFHRFRDEDDLSFMRRFWLWEEWRELYFNICDECERVLSFGD
ncbi:MAG: hypothetical protein IJY15_05000 [Thermoguttaceae bacterium]|nr:hypothetical protein [Thermoguttaceae bacterium]